MHLMKETGRLIWLLLDYVRVHKAVLRNHLASVNAASDHLQNSADLFI